MQYETTGCYPCILVCAPSNNAIDEIANRLMNEIDSKYDSKLIVIKYDLFAIFIIVFSITVVRIGVPATMNPDVVRISLDKLSGEKLRDDAAKTTSSESRHLLTLKAESNTLQRKKKKLVAAILNANKVVFCFVF
jgi:hypothetical protein